jgi:peptide chain release factor 1
MVDFEPIKKEYEDILNQLSSPELISDWEKFEELSKKKEKLEKIIEKQKEMEEIKNKIEENRLILSSNEDRELVSLAAEELKNLLDREKFLGKELKNLLKKKGNEVSQGLDSEQKSKGDASAIIEIRAGTGGEEAALFAASLFKMYSKYGQNQNWKMRVLDSHPTELGGFKEIIFGMEDGNVFSKMKYEGGVHRVQRIPTTEKGGRIHTSTASVAVLPKPKKAEIKINPVDLKIDFYGASGPGGQYVQKRHTAVRITHLPTGIVVSSQSERNQLKNKENAMSILAAKILEKKEMAEEKKMHGKRRSQIKWAKRAEKIRTYNFPQDRITDHRIKKSWHNLEEIMSGKLDVILKDLEKYSND